MPGAGPNSGLWGASHTHPKKPTCSRPPEAPLVASVLNQKGGEGVLRPGPGLADLQGCLHNPPGPFQRTGQFMGRGVQRVSPSARRKRGWFTRGQGQGGGGPSGRQLPAGRGRGGALRCPQLIPGIWRLPVPSRSVAPPHLSRQSQSHRGSLSTPGSASPGTPPVPTRPPDASPPAGRRRARPRPEREGDAPGGRRRGRSALRRGQARGRAGEAGVCVCVWRGRGCSAAGRGLRCRDPERGEKRATAPGDGGAVGATLRGSSRRIAPQPPAAGAALAR